MKEFLRRPIVACILVAVLIAFGVSIAVNPTPATADSGCADVKFFGLAGSGERGSHEGLGKTVFVASEKFKEVMLAKGASYEVFPVDYTAIAVWPIPPIDKFYDSVNDGVNELSKALDKAASACGDQKFVLVGYSQGAFVIKKILNIGKHKDRVKAVLLFGDPTLNPKDGSLYPRRPGRFPGGQAGPGNLTMPSWVKEKHSYCLTGDPVCHGMPDNLVSCTLNGWTPPCPHVMYQLDVAAEGGQWLAELFTGSSNPTPQPTQPTPNPRPTPTRPTPTQPAPAGAVQIKNMFVRDTEEVATSSLYCNEQFQMVYTIESSFRSPVQATVRARAFDHDWVNTQTTIQPGANNIFTPATVPLREPEGSTTWEVSVSYPGGNAHEQQSFRVEGPCGG